MISLVSQQKPPGGLRGLEELQGDLREHLLWAQRGPAVSVIAAWSPHSEPRSVSSLP